MRQVRGCWKASWVRMLATACCLLLAAGCGERRSKQWTDIGDTQFRLGNLSEARQAYEKARAAAPNNAAPRAGLARCYWAEGDADAALAAYREAMECDPGLAAPYLESVEILLRSGRTDEARRIAEDFAARDAEKGGMLLSGIDLGTGQFDAAIERLLGLRDQFPGSAEVRLFLAKAYLAVDRPADAQAELDHVIDVLDPDSLAARMILIDVYERQGRLADIVRELEDLTQRHPDDNNLKLAMARSLMAVGRFEEAEATAFAVLKAAPDSGWANFILGRCLIEKGEYEQAVQCLQAARHALPQEKAVQELLALALNRGETPPSGPGETATAAVAPSGAAMGWRELWRAARLRELVNESGAYLKEEGGAAGDFVVCGALFLGRMDQVEELLKALPEDSPMREYVTRLRERDANQLMAFLGRWTESDPLRKDLKDNAEAFALALGGARASALRILSRSIDERPDDGVALLNAAMLFGQTGMPEFQIASMKRLIEVAPDNLDARLLLCEVFWNAGLDKEALTQAQTTFAAFPDNPNVLRTLARAYRETGETAPAAQALERALQLEPNAAATRVQSAELYTSLGSFEEARKLLEGISPPPVLRDATDFLRAVTAALTGDWAPAAAVWQAREKAGEADAVPLPIRLLAAGAFVHDGRREEGARCLTPGERVSSAYLDKTRIARVALGSVPETAPSSAEAALSGALAKDQEAFVDYLLAVACVEGRIENAALPIIQRLEARLGAFVPLNVLMMRAFARADVEGGRLAAAKSYVEKHAEQPAVWLGLAGIARMEDDAALEEQALARAVELAQDSAEVWAAIAAFRDRQGDFAGALAANRRLFELAPGRPEVKNNLAYSILRTGGDPSEALQLAKAAVEGLGNNPHALHTLGLAYRQTGDLDEAYRRIASALELRPGDPTLLYDYGRVLIGLGKPQEGRQHIELAVQYATQLGLTFPELDDARKTLEELPAASAGQS